MTHSIHGEEALRFGDLLWCLRQLRYRLLDLGSCVLGLQQSTLLVAARNSDCLLFITGRVYLLIRGRVRCVTCHRLVILQYAYMLDCLHDWRLLVYSFNGFHLDGILDHLSIGHCLRRHNIGRNLLSSVGLYFLRRIAQGGLLCELWSSSSYTVVDGEYWDLLTGYILGIRWFEALHTLLLNYLLVIMTL